MGKTLCFVNNKGGCGKTTTCCAIGQAWARLEKKILFIDLDSQSNLTSIVTDTDPSEKEWETTIEDAFVGGPEFGLPIHSVSENIDIVPADLDLSNFDRDTARQTVREFLLADLLATVKDKYDYILIDCPPALGVITYNALVASDYMVMVTNAEGLSYRGMKMVANLYNEVITNKRLNPNLMLIGVIVTRYEKNNLSDMYLDKIESDLGGYLIRPVVRKSTKIAQSASFQQNIYEFDPAGRATQDYLKVANELLERIEIK
jgi:chromosome partitioning protein